MLTVLFNCYSIVVMALLKRDHMFLDVDHSKLLPPFFSGVRRGCQAPTRDGLLFVIVMKKLTTFIPTHMTKRVADVNALFTFALIYTTMLVIHGDVPSMRHTFGAPFIPAMPVLNVLAYLYVVLFLPTSA